jgi:ZIP family zinc transporter
LIGTFLVLFFNLNKKMIAFTLGLSAGVLILISYMTLLPTALASGGFFHLIAGMVTAIFTMILLHLLPFSKVKGEGDEQRFARLGNYLLFAVAAHNFPEGAAIGIGFEMEHDLGQTLAIAMAIHNIPEGIGMAAPLVAAGKHPLVILVLCLISGGVLPLGTWLGIHFLSRFPDVISVGLGFAATTMVWIVVCEVCPKAFSLHKRSTFIGLVIGVLFMYIIHLFH